MTKDVFLISAEAEIIRLSRLMNKASKAYWGLKDRKTEYAKMLYAGYLMNKEMIEKVRDLVTKYKRNSLFQPCGHPLTSVVGETTKYCADCAKEAA